MPARLTRDRIRRSMLRRRIIEEELEQAQERLNAFVAKFGSLPDVE